MNIDNKKHFQDRIEAEFKERRAELEKIKAKVEKAQAEAKLGLDDDIKVLDEQLNQLQDKIDQLKSSGEETWEQLKIGVSTSLEEFKNTLSRVKNNT